MILEWHPVSTKPSAVPGTSILLKEETSLKTRYFVSIISPNFTFEKAKHLPFIPTHWALLP